MFSGGRGMYLDWVLRDFKGKIIFPHSAQWQAPFDESSRARAERNNKQALDLLESLAEEQMLEARVNLAGLLSCGAHDVPEDMQRARELADLCEEPLMYAAGRDCADALYVLYIFSRWREPGRPGASREAGLRRAAVMGHPQALRELWVWQGIERGASRARDQMLFRAARYGNNASKYRLACHLLGGEAGLADYSVALHWLRLAAAEGNAPAARALDRLLEWLGDESPEEHDHRIRGIGQPPLHVRVN